MGGGGGGAKGLDIGRGGKGGQIITFLSLKFDNIENSRIKLKGIVLPVPSNQIKVIFTIIYPSTVQL